MGSILKPTKEKIIISFLNSLILIFVFLSIPSLGFQSIFLKKELPTQIISLVVSLLFSLVVYYPFGCGLVYVFKIITKKEKIKVQNLVISLLFIIIFNIITFSFVITNIMKYAQVNSPKEKLCGLQIIEVIAPSAESAGLSVGEIIKTINDYPVYNMDDLTNALANKKPNDTVTVITNANTHNVILFANSQNPQQILMGIKLKVTECEK